MGIETQLFYVKLHEPTPYDELRKILVKLGCHEVENLGILGKGFEILSSKGITEILPHVNNKGNVSELSVRFSLLNPETVVEQTLHFLESLTEIISCDTCITEPKRKIDQINTQVLQESMFEKIRHFVKITNSHQKPIRAGEETFDYIREYKKKQEKEEK